MVCGFYWPPEIETIGLRGIPMINTGLLLGTIYPCNVAQRAIKSARLNVFLQ